MITVIETWSVIDKWWKPKEEWVEREYAAVEWYGRQVVFVQTAPDKIWRIYATNTL